MTPAPSDSILNNNNTNSNKRQVSIYLPEDIYNKLVQMAEEDDRPLVSYIRCVLKDHIAKIN